ncbi:TetR/AcrR family transcriptional regulator [Caloramator australicus]|uniref:Transcriptional regulator, TetR family n=1 Tax=Caloramator australicus RC3 TaxID=857293 RepID=I7K8W6_9CLOT|nr:TetR/AcrR family transcriptional regulator [Caloramator australicus]CCJ34000.1 Transcriptional regulator, TetR family [Caloramator australicus RC3]
MLKAFEKLSEEKRSKIIKAALEEFANNGYEKASTNRIVEKAEISKGLLFHYFKNKKRLYLYLIDYVIPVIFDEFFKTADMNIGDFFERLKNWQVAKLNIFEKLSLESKFLIRAFSDIPEEVKEEVLKRYQNYAQEGFKLLFSNIDYSKFRDGIDKNKAVETIVWTLENYGNKYMKENMDNEGNIVIDTERILKDIDEYLEILKYGCIRG